MTNPTGYPNLQKAGVPHDDWCWDTPTRIKTEGPKQSLATSKNILSLIVLLHGLDLLKGVCIKLQKHDADIVTAYRHIDLAIEEVSYMREDFDSVWSEWFGEAESLATDIGAVITIPRICKYQQHHSNVPAYSPSEYYKRCLGIPFLDSLLSQMNENRVVQSLMSLCPSIICKLCKTEGFRRSGKAAAILGSWYAKRCLSKAKASSLETLLEWRQTWRQTRGFDGCITICRWRHFSKHSPTNFNWMYDTDWNLSGRKVFFSFETNKTYVQQWPKKGWQV